MPSSDSFELVGRHGFGRTVHAPRSLRVEGFHLASERDKRQKHERTATVEKDRQGDASVLQATVDGQFFRAPPATSSRDVSENAPRLSLGIQRS